MDIKKYLKHVKNKIAGAGVATAIKVLTSIVCGAVMLTGGYGIVKEVVLPSTQTQVESLAEYEAEGGAGGGAGGEEDAGEETGPIEHMDIVAEGATYRTLSGTVYNAGEELSGSPESGDTYTYGDYIYTYTPASNGWKVAINTSANPGAKWKTSFGAIISGVNGVPVTDLTNTFNGCQLMTSAPDIPASVTNMAGTFTSCYELTSAPALPPNVEILTRTFSGCKKIGRAPVIPDSVINMEGTFTGCGFTTFGESYVIPASVETIKNCFSNMPAPTTPPILSEGLQDMSSAFSGCNMLMSAPEIPSTVTNMTNAFSNCSWLRGDVVVNANPNDYDGCFTGTNITSIGGSTTLKDELLATK